MVHALEEIRRLLKPGGFLIDIHPIRKAPLIKVVQGNDVLFIESDPGYDSDEGLMHADEALEEIVRRGLFRIEGRNEFEMVMYASSVAEMRDYWAKYGAFDDEPKDDAIVARKDEVYAKADEIMQNAQGAEITYHERARITRLKPDARE
jgi:SAM-dependent methyltransferase